MHAIGSFILKTQLLWVGWDVSEVWECFWPQLHCALFNVMKILYLEQEYNVLSWKPTNETALQVLYERFFVTFCVVIVPLCTQSNCFKAMSDGLCATARTHTYTLVHTHTSCSLTCRWPPLMSRAQTLFFVSSPYLHFHCLSNVLLRISHAFVHNLRSLQSVFCWGGMLSARLCGPTV